MAMTPENSSALASFRRVVRDLGKARFLAGRGKRRSALRRFRSLDLERVHSVGWIWFDGNLYCAPELGQVGLEKTHRIVSLLQNLSPPNPPRSPLMICQITREIVFAANRDEVGSETCPYQRADSSVIAALKKFEDFLHSFG